MIGQEVPDRPKANEISQVALTPNHPSVRKIVIPVEIDSSFRRYIIDVVVHSRHGMRTMIGSVDWSVAFEACTRIGSRPSPIDK